jgi:SAM-dependent methyltransferase
MPDTAVRHADLWSDRAGDWAEVERQQLPTYEAALDRVAFAPGDRVLDIGCGSGVCLAAAAARGAQVAGLDASPALLAIARERVPDADLCAGDMEAMPFDDDAFDLVTGFNAFFFAADIVGALREAGRVAKPGAPVVIQVWGDPERCDLSAMKHAWAALVPPSRGAAVAQKSLALYEPGVLEDLASAAGLEPQEAFDSSWAYVYDSDDAVARAMLSPGLVVEVIRAVGEPAVREAILGALAPFRGPDGTYRLSNEWHYLIARA